MDKDGFIIHEFSGIPLVSVAYYGKEFAEILFKTKNHINLRYEELKLTHKDPHDYYVAVREDAIIKEFQKLLNHWFSVSLPKLVMCAKEDVEETKRRLISGYYN